MAGYPADLIAQAAEATSRAVAEALGHLRLQPVPQKLISSLTNLRNRAIQR